MEHTSYYAILIEESEAPFKESLRKVFKLMVDSCDDSDRESGCLITNSTYEMASVDEEIFDEMKKHLSQMKQTIINQICLAQESGEIDKEKDVDSLAAYIMTLIKGLLVSSRVTKNKTEMRNTVKLGLSILD
ncbi:MAG: hypothetical protein CMF45_05390 [Legionellales bacterium]|nr:hypothetical protein [Legionellales bacterium]|tara:strand:- start:763 stop:1158 length:396 start_codon:yes stop_codon:yes gene_type:complete